MVLNSQKIIIISLIVISKLSFCAVDQILTSNFFQNPAELSLVDNWQLIAGNVYTTSTLNFSGTTPLGVGQAQSRVRNNLPYILSAKRLSDKFVIGLNATPSGYGHVHWPFGSIVETLSTTTNTLYYRFGAQMSYQILDNLALGIGLNNEYEQNAEIDFVIAGLGNQVNKISGNNFVGDIGLYYKINSNNFITIAAYSPVDTFGRGTSTLGAITVNNLLMDITDAAVVYIGLKHIFNDNWTVEGKVYWSGWSLEKEVSFINTTTGSFSNPANWSDIWSFQGIIRRTLTEKVALLGGLIYETNAVPTAMNHVGYPLSSSAAASIGLDVILQKALSAQIVYTYGGFVPSAKIDNTKSTGTVSANFQAALLQFTYKV